MATAGPRLHEQAPRDWRRVLPRSGPHVLDYVSSASMNAPYAVMSERCVECALVPVFVYTAADNVAEVNKRFLAATAATLSWMAGLSLQGVFWMRLVLGTCREPPQRQLDVTSNRNITKTPWCVAWGCITAKYRPPLASKVHALLCRSASQ